MIKKPTIVYTWKDLIHPIPRDRPLEITATLERWRHIICDSTHLRDEQRHWQNWLTASIFSQLEKCFDGTVSGEDRKEIIAKACDAMSKEIGMSVNSPYVLAYTRRKQTGDDGVRVWHVPLQNGASFIVGGRSKQRCMLTCYFSEFVRTSYFDLQGVVFAALCNGLLTLYAENDQYPSQDFKRTTKAHQDSKIDFITAENWGFASKKPGAKCKRPATFSWPQEDKPLKLQKRRL